MNYMFHIPTDHWRKSVEENRKTFHRGQLTGHTAAILMETPAVVCNASGSLRFTVKLYITSHRVAGPIPCHCL